MTSDASSAELRTVDGRVPGRRGLVTRGRLLECLIDMLRTSSYRDVKVTDVARRAGTSPATFYQYFPDIETAVLTLADEMAQEGTALRDLVKGQAWRGAAGYRSAEALVDGFLEFWRTHQHLLRVVDLASLEGDDRFRAVRVSMLNTVTTALADVITEVHDARGGLDFDPTAMSGSLVSMLAHVAAHQFGFEAWDIHMTDVRRSLAHLVYWGVTGRKPPRA